MSPTERMWWEARHDSGCQKRQDTNLPCTCSDLDEMVEDFQVAKPYVRTPRVPVSAPQGPYQSLATMIRAARTAGLLKPVQGYIDHSLKAGRP